jgi:hypothetical protein
VLSAQNFVESPYKRTPVLPISVNPLEPKRVSVKRPNKANLEHIWFVVDADQLLTVKAGLDGLAQALEQF